MRSLVPFLALRHIRRRPLQSALTTLGVAVGVTVLLVALSLTNGFVDELISSTLEATPHISLSAREFGVTFADDPALLEAIEAHPDVVAAAPVLTTQALIARRADAELGLRAAQGFTQVVGVDPEREAEVLALDAIRRRADALRGDGIVLGSSLAAQLGALPGDRVTLLNIRQQRATLEVATTFRVGNELIDGLTSYMGIPALQAYLGVPGEISGFHVRLADPQRAAVVGPELAGRTGLLPTTWERTFSGLVDQLRLQKAVISVVVFLIVLVAAMGIANILIVTVAEKTEEIAIVRALGASERQVLLVFTLEGLVLGGGGTLLGVALGLGASLYFAVQPFPLPGDLYFITRLPMAVQAGDVLWVAAVSLVTSTLAGLVPARRAARLDPADILR